MKKTLKLISALTLMLGLLLHVNIKTNAVGIGKTFAEQFPSIRTAEQISRIFGKLPTDEIDSADLDATTFFLSGTSLTDITGIGIFTKLEGLFLYGNQLTELPNEIENLTNLKVLGVADNMLTTLPNTIGNLSQLEHFNIANNAITNLPDEISNLNNLLQLIAEGNQLTSLPTTIGNLSNLIELNVLNNELTSLPTSLLNIKSTVKLIVGQNLLPTNYLAELTTLGFVNIDQNGDATDLQKKLVIDSSSVLEYDVTTITEYETALSSTVLTTDSLISTTHSFIFDSAVDSSDMPVNISDYILNDVIIKSGTVKLKIRSTGDGLFPNNSDNALTNDYITIHFKSDFFTVIFDPNGGGGDVPANKRVEKGTLIPAVSEIPKKAGYKFVGWSVVRDDVKSKWDFENDLMYQEDLILYALWEEVIPINPIKPDNTRPIVGNRLINTGNDLNLMIILMLAGLMGSSVIFKLRRSRK